MSDNQFMKEVYFDQYCPFCKHVNYDDGEDVCHYCLETPAREYSHKPINFEERKKK